VFILVLISVLFSVHSVLEGICRAILFTPAAVGAQERIW